MRYRVEYLCEATEEKSVVHHSEAEEPLEIVEMRAFLCASQMRRDFGAEGFQIRDLSSDGRIVALALFDDPLGRFWPDPGHRVIH